MWLKKLGVAFLSGFLVMGMVEKLEADHIVGYPLIYEAKDIVERMQNVY